MYELLTYTWLPATGNKPWKNRLVAGRFLDDDGEEYYAFCKWNGMYWVGQKGMRLMMGQEPTHFMIIEKFNENDIL